MTRICHVTSVHPAKDVRIFYKECRSLANKYEVYLVAPNVEDQVIDNVHLVGVHLPVGRFKRIFHLDSVMNKALSVDADVYHFHDPELISMGLKFKRLGKKVIFDAHEDISVDIRCKTWIPRMFRSVCADLYSKYEKKALSQYDALVSVTPSIVEKLSAINGRVAQVTNYPIIEKRHNHSWERAICFAGGVSKNWMHLNILDSIEDIDLKYFLAGRTDKNYIEQLKSKKAWNKVEFKGMISQDEVKDMYARASIGMAVYDYGYPDGKMGTLGNTKLFEYMQAGLPVVSSDLVLWKEIVEKYHCGICVCPRNVADISCAIKYLLEHPTEAKEMGENGRLAAEQLFNWNTQEAVLFELYDYIISK